MRILDLPPYKLLGLSIIVPRQHLMINLGVLQVATLLTPAILIALRLHFGARPPIIRSLRLVLTRLSPDLLLRLIIIELTIHYLVLLGWTRRAICFLQGPRLLMELARRFVDVL